MRLPNLGQLHLNIPTHSWMAQSGLLNRRPETHTSMDARGNVKGLKTLYPNAKKQKKTDDELAAWHEQNNAKKAQNVKDTAERSVAGAVAAKERDYFTRTPNYIKRLMAEEQDVLTTATFALGSMPTEEEQNKLEGEIEAAKEATKNLQTELDEKLATLDTLLHMTAHTVEDMQKQIETLKEMRGWFDGGGLKDGALKKYNDEQQAQIDAKMKELSTRVGFLVEHAAKEHAERERMQKNRERKERHQKAIDNNDPEELWPSEQEPGKWWDKEGKRQAQKKAERDTREAALQQANWTAPDPIVPEKVDLPQGGLSKAEWEEALNAQLAGFARLAVEEARQERAEVARLVDAYEQN